MVLPPPRPGPSPRARKRPWTRDDKVAEALGFQALPPSVEARLRAAARPAPPPAAPSPAPPVSASPAPPARPPAPRAPPAPPPPVAAPTPPRPATRPAPPPRGEHRAALVATALLLAAVGAAVVLAPSPRDGGAPVSGGDAALGTGLPDAAPDDGPVRFRVLGGGDPERAAEEASRGVVLLVFARPGTASGDAAVALAADLSRRLRGRGPSVALVVDRDAVAPAGGDPAAALAAAGVEGGVGVVIDAPEGLRARRRVGDGAAALLLVDGVERARAVPAEAGEPPTLSLVAPLAAEALGVSARRSPRGAR